MTVLSHLAILPPSDPGESGASGKPGRVTAICDRQLARQFAYVATARVAGLHVLLAGHL